MQKTNINKMCLNNASHKKKETMIYIHKRNTTKARTEPKS